MKRLLISLILVPVLRLSAVHAAEVLAPPPGSPMRETILNDLRAAEPTVSTQKEKKQKIIFEKVTLRVAGDWAWFSVGPRTQDGTWHSEMLTGLMHHSGGHWRVIEYVGDEVASANNPQRAYDAWRAALLKKNPECPPALVPKKE